MKSYPRLFQPPKSSFFLFRRINCFFLVLLFCCSVFSLGASAKEEAVNLDKVDARLFQDIKVNTGKSDAEIYEVLGTTYAAETEIQNPDRAIKHFKEAVGLDPSLFLSWYNLGILMIESEEGNECFRKAIDANPRFAEPYYWLAYNHARVRKDHDALSYFEQYLRVADPKDANESGRINVAKKAIAELRAGVDGDELKTIRIPVAAG